MTYKDKIKNLIKHLELEGNTCVALEDKAREEKSNYLEMFYAGAKYGLREALSQIVLYLVGDEK